MTEDEAVDGIYTGALASKIKKNLRFTLTGLAIGGFIGYFAASIMGQNKLLFIFAGASIGAAVGKYSAPKPEEKKTDELPQ